MNCVCDPNGSISFDKHIFFVQGLADREGQLECFSMLGLEIIGREEKPLKEMCSCSVSINHDRTSSQT